MLGGLLSPGIRCYVDMVGQMSDIDFYPLLPVYNQTPVCYCVAFSVFYVSLLIHKASLVG